MIFKDYIKYEIDILREKVIGSEVTIADTPVLILGIQECQNESVYYDSQEGVVDPDEPEKYAFLYLLYEDEPDELDWDEEMDLEEDPEGNWTRRQAKMEVFSEPHVPHVADIEAFLINNEQIPTRGMSNGTIVDISYQEGHMISNAAKAGKISENWLEIDEQRLWCAAYRLDVDAFDANWACDNSAFDVIMEKQAVEVYVGEKFVLHPGDEQELVTVAIVDSKGHEEKVTVRGLHVETIPGWPDEDGEEKHILCLQYEAPPNLQMNFFRTEYLDTELTDHEGGVFAMIVEGEEKKTRYEYLDYVPKDYNEPTEIELFSYTIIEMDDSDIPDIK